ncbi:hypothetical protein HK105_208556 [Polyrhizophydium stewartii]|uniref:THO complex subunit 3 n=1 Tax=Polyrhizophydium stewartii TaxID=2732419 RepID=A0ABR4MXH5_9FUNG
MVTSAVSRFRAGADKTESRELRAHTERIKSAAWNKEGRKLASCSADKSVRIWSIDRSQSRDVLELRGHTRAVSCVAWDPEHSDKFASTSTDSTLRLWDVRSYRSETHVVQTKGENINMSWSSDGACIAVGNKARSTARNCGASLKWANQFGWNFAGDLFFITTGTGRVKIFEYPSLKEVHTLFAHTSNAYCIDFEPSGRYFATGGADAIVALWDVETLTSVQTYTQLDWPIRALSFSFDGEFVAFGSEDTVIEIVHTETAERVHTLKTNAAVNSIAWHPSKCILAFATDAADHHSRPASLQVVSFPRWT